MTKVIDYLAYYASPGGAERFNKLHEEETMLCKLAGVYKGGTPFAPPEETIARMDNTGVERVFFAKLLMFSYLFKRPLEVCTIDELGEVVTSILTGLVDMLPMTPSISPIAWRK